jgi:hypothetical protein
VSTASSYPLSFGAGTLGWNIFCLSQDRRYPARDTTCGLEKSVAEGVVGRGTSHQAISLGRSAIMKDVGYEINS